MLNKTQAQAAVSIAAIFFLLQSTLATADVTSTDREKILEERVQYLESRVQRLEALINQNADQRPATSSVPSEASLPTATASPEVAAAVAASSARTQSEAKPGTSSGRVEEGASDAPQELNVLRENSVTLKPRRFEISTDVEYASRRTDLQQDSSFISNTSLRYGVLDWLELGLTIPYGRASRSTNVGLEQAVTKNISGLGDITLQANARVLQQSSNWPGVVLSLGAIFPTGRTPYNFTNYSFDSANFARTPNPSDPLGDYYSKGAWGIRTNLQFYKTVDPLIIFFGFGADYLFPQHISGFTVDNGFRYNYNLGFSFATSEKTTLGFSFNGAYTPAMRVNGREVFNSSGYLAVVRLTLIQRLVQDLYLEPSILFGLNQDSPDFSIGATLRYRF